MLMKQTPAIKGELPAPAKIEDKSVQA